MKNQNKGVTQKWMRAFFLLAVAVQVSGCTAAGIVAGGAAGAAGVVWVKGNLHETIDAPVAKVHQAVLATLKAFELPVEENRKDGFSAEVRSRLADGKRLWIDLDSVSESATRISIRIGTFGDESRSRRVLARIHGFL